ncbi:MAG: 50S ribosomal protein L10 [bacterium]|nr:50S ribosomal protein L10 [bacterium]
MKSKAQKQEELKRGKEFLEKSRVLVFTDFTKLPAEDMRRLRKELKTVGANFLVIKKRLLNILLKDKKIDFDVKQFKLSVGTVFSESDTEKISAPVYKLFSSLEIPEGAAKDIWIKHILGGYDLKHNAPIAATDIVFIGKLPPREVLLAQLFGMLAAPIKSFLYLLDQHRRKVGAPTSSDRSVGAEASEKSTS